MTATRKYFGTDGIRGVANEGVLTPDFVTKIGQAIGLSFENGKRHQVLIAKDTRVSGYTIEYALASGLTSVGVDVLLCGPMPTPGLAMLTRSMLYDFGIMISASHNSFEDNGLKIFAPDGYKLSDEKESQIEVLIEADLSKRLAKGNDLGRIKRDEAAQQRYIQFAKQTFALKLSTAALVGIRAVLDTANGAAYKVAPLVLRELGAEVFTIGDEPDGTNINLNCGSTSIKPLIAKVKELRADIGIALDGDADRVVMVDENGTEINGDQLIAIVAESWQQDGRLAKPLVVGTVMSNLGLERYLTGLNIDFVRAPVGDRYVIEAMRENGSNLGGEQSGHIIMPDYTTTGDGLIASLQLLAVVKRSGKKFTVSEIAHHFDPVPQIKKDIRFKGENPLEVPAVAEAVEQGKQLLGKEYFIVRKSGTEPLIRVMGQGDDKAVVESVVNKVTDAVKAVQ